MLHAGAHPARSGSIADYGFSLVEALVVVMVVLVIAAIAIPGFVQARIKANEASAVSSMRTIRTAEILYSQTYPAMGFSKTLPDLGSRGSTCESSGPSNACIITDDALARGFKSGYVFELISDGQTPSLAYRLNGIPENAGISGHCVFSTDESGSITSSVSGGGTVLRYSLGSGSASCEQ